MSSCPPSPSSLATETGACKELADLWCLDGQGGRKLGRGGGVADVLGGREGVADVIGERRGGSCGSGVIYAACELCIGK